MRGEQFRIRLPIHVVREEGQCEFWFSDALAGRLAAIRRDRVSSRGIAAARLGIHANAIGPP